MKIIFYSSIFIFTISCGYPDVDNVPDFTNIFLSDEEINDYCESTYTVKENIDKCIIDYKSKN